MAEVLDLQVLTDEVTDDVAFIEPHTDGSGYSWNC